MQKIILATLMTLCLIAGALAHTRLVYPTPRTSENGLYTYPCGGVQFFGNGQPITTIAPGQLTVQFQGTLYPTENSHDGSPYRLALSVGGDDDYNNLVLLDHIPHATNNVVNRTSFNYSITVTIPDINCPKCSLAMYNVQTRDMGTCCSYPPSSTNTSVTCKTAFHSCANIVITGTKSIEAFKSSYYYSGPCGDYTYEETDYVKNSDGSLSLSTTGYVPPATQRCSNFKSVCKSSASSVFTFGVAVVMMLFLALF